MVIVLHCIIVVLTLFIIEVIEIAIVIECSIFLSQASNLKAAKFNGIL